MFGASRGSSIVQIMVMIGVVSIILSASLTMVQKARQDQKNIANKIEHRAIQALVKDIMSRDSECNCQVAGKTFDLSDPNRSFSLSSLKSSCAPGAPDLITTSSVFVPNRLTANSMIVNNIGTTSNANEYTGELSVGFQISSSNSIRQLKADPIKFTFHTDPASSDSAKLIRGCGRSPLIAATDLRATPGPVSNTCSFSWREASGAKPITYTVRGSSTRGAASAGTKICQVQDATTCTIGGLTNGTRYYFAIQSSNSTQGSTSYSAEVTCVPLAAASVPVLNSPVFGDSACNLSWAASTGSGPINYTVYQSTTLPVTQDSTVVCRGVAGTNCTSSGLTNGTTYYYAMTASNGLGESALSNTVTCNPCPANYHYVGGSCIKTYTERNHTVSDLGQNRLVSQSLGFYHYCVLTGYSYDGTNDGSCRLSGSEDGNWTVTIFDEDATNPQYCIVSCSMVDLTSSDPFAASICSASGKTGIRRGACCAVGTFSDRNASNDIGCH